MSLVHDVFSSPEVQCDGICHCIARTVEIVVHWSHTNDYTQCIEQLRNRLQQLLVDKLTGKQDSKVSY